MSVTELHDEYFTDTQQRTYILKRKKRKQKKKQKKRKEIKCPFNQVVSKNKFQRKEDTVVLLTME